LGRHYKGTVGPHSDYKYPHAYPGHWVEQQYMPPGVEGGWYQPSDQGYESKIAERLARQSSRKKKNELDSNETD
jgi:putative ATPase